MGLSFSVAGLNLQHRWLQMLPVVSSFLCGAQGTGAFLRVPAPPSTSSRSCPPALHREPCSRQRVGRLLLLVCGARPVVGQEGSIPLVRPQSHRLVCWGCGGGAFSVFLGQLESALCLWGSGVGGSLLPLPWEQRLLLRPQPQLSLLGAGRVPALPVRGRLPVSPSPRSWGSASAFGDESFSC